VFSIRKAAALVLLLGSGGCAIHPLPEDFAGDKTTRIVQKIRCEARDSVIRKTIVYLKIDASRFPKAHALGVSYENGLPIQIKDFIKIEPVIGSRLLYFSDAGIVYNFTFNIAETNDLQFAANAGTLITGGTFGLGGGLGALRVRENVRSFTITDSFGTLVEQIDPRYCDFEAPGPNYIYPIVGRIGLAEMVNTFVDLTVFHGLTDPIEGGKPKTPLAHRGAPTMADTLAFTTTLTASATPKIELAPLTSAFTLVNASLTSANIRVDKHQVIVGLGLPNAPVSEPSVSLTRSIITARASRGTGERAAADAVAQQIIRFELLNNRSVFLTRPLGDVTWPTTTNRQETNFRH
jgi:hypothetical protein